MSPFSISSPTVVYVSDPESAPRLSYLSENVEQLLGYPSRQFIEDPQFWVGLLHREDRERAVTGRSGRSVDCVAQLEYRLRRSDGEYRWIRDSVKPVADSAGVNNQRIGFWIDITNLREPNAAPARRPISWPSRLFDGSAGEIPAAVYDFGNALPVLFFIYDLVQHRFVLVNRAYQAVLGYSFDQIKAMGPEFLPKVMHPDDMRRMLEQRQRYDTLTDGEALESEDRMMNARNEYRWLSSRAVVIARDAQGRARQILGVSQDVTERKRLEEQLVHTALYDALTDLPNRALFLERLERAIRRGKRQPNYRFAVLYLDLDRFKVINDGLGHLAGDQMLVFIARRLEACLREGETFARLGGDEFALLMEGLVKESDALLLAERIQRELRKPFLLGVTEVVTSTSIGIAFSHMMYENPKEVLRDADIALYRAKEQGLGCYQIFDEAMHDRMRRQIKLEEELRRAMERQEFELYYQPIRSLKNGALLGLEALVRWQHPTRGLLLPEDFLSAAEESGLMLPLGWWVLRDACRTGAAWVREGVLPPGAYVSVNLASRQFGQLDVVERVAAALAESQLPGDRLRLEILESAILDVPAVVLDKMTRLRALGVGVLLDDFGTGYSSLSRLVSFPIDGMKIDRTFINSITRSASHRMLVQALIHLAHDLQLSVIAEGVETAEQAAMLKDLGCEAVQGLMFLPPMPASRVGDAVRVEGSGSSGSAIV